LVAAIVSIVLVRAITTVWAWAGLVPEDGQFFFGYVVVEIIADAAILAVAGVLIIRFTRQTAKTEREQRRIEHLTSMALLSGGLAHEIRNHLNGLGTYISLFRKSAEKYDGELLGRIEKLEHVVSDLDELVSDFLTLTRPLKDKLEDIDLTELVSEIVEFLSLDFEQAHVEVQVDAKVGVPRVKGDRGKLRRAILNLLVNARQSMPSGGNVLVRLHAGGGQVWLDIEDTGCGISPNDQPRIFDAFFSTKSEGSGLGLAVVKRTIDDLGGTVSFESQVGRGTTFHIILPSARQYEARMWRLGRRPLDPASPES
jgi:signal transduction histidine kinase